MIIKLLDKKSVFNLFQVSSSIKLLFREVPEVYISALIEVWSQQPGNVAAMMIQDNLLLEEYIRHIIPIIASVIKKETIITSLIKRQVTVRKRVQKIIWLNELDRDNFKLYLTNEWN